MKTKALLIFLCVLIPVFGWLGETLQTKTVQSLLDLASKTPQKLSFQIKRYKIAKIESLSGPVRVKRKLDSIWTNPQEGTHLSVGDKLYIPEGSEAQLFDHTSESRARFSLETLITVRPHFLEQTVFPFFFERYAENVSVELLKTSGRSRHPASFLRTINHPAGDQFGLTQYLHRYQSGVIELVRQTKTLNLHQSAHSYRFQTGNRPHRIPVSVDPLQWRSERMRQVLALLWSSRDDAPIWARSVGQPRFSVPVPSDEGAYTLKVLSDDEVFVSRPISITVSADLFDTREIKKILQGHSSLRLGNKSK